MKSGDRLTESPIHTVFRIRNLPYKTSHCCEQRSEWRNESSYSQNIIQTYPKRVPAGYYYNSPPESRSLTLPIHQEHSLILFSFLRLVSSLSADQNKQHQMVDHTFEF